MGDIKSTYFDLELNNGDTVSLTLNFGRLYKLRMKNRDLYERYNNTQRKGKKEFDELDLTVIIYTAYVCANIDSENLFTYEEFLELMPCDRKILGACITALIAPSKKKADSQKHFKELQKK